MGREWAAPRIKQLRAENVNTTQKELRNASVTSALIPEWIMGNTPSWD